MEFFEREFYLSRIRLDYIPIVVNDKQYKVVYPSDEIEHEANQLYVNIMQNYDGLTTDDLVNLNIELKHWSDSLEKLLSKIPPELEELKIALYKNYSNESQRAILKSLIESKNNEYNDLYFRKIRGFNFTKEWTAAYIKQVYIISKCTYNIKGKRVKIGCEDLYYAYSAQSLDVAKIREISRTQPWVSYWSACKVNNSVIFDKLNKDRQSLLYWSKFYDSIRENPEGPSEGVINDDDALDGWLILRGREIESARLRKEIENKLGNKNPGDVGIFVNNEVEAKKIDSLNTEHAKLVKSQRSAKLKKHGELREDQLPDKQQELLSMLSGAKR